MISQEISQELNQAFYNNDVKKARNLKRQILVDKHISTELKDRADLIINILNSGDDTASIK